MEASTNSSGSAARPAPDQTGKYICFFLGGPDVYLQLPADLVKERRRNNSRMRAGGPAHFSQVSPILQ